MDESYMKIALELALKGEGAVNPNPLVGAVVVKNGSVIGTGYHKFYGGPHAEVYALKEAGENAKDADMYVTLEPCSHYGKTPPCAEAILKAGIKRVFISMEDPNPIVAGRGIKMLREKGVEVKVGILKNEAEKVNEIFIKYITKKEPFVLMKTAMTLDGKIASQEGDSKWITGEESRKYVHKIRNKVMGIMVGIGTVIKDNPLLTTRLDEGGRSPKAIIVDSKLRIPLNSKIFDTLNQREMIIACTENYDREKKETLEKMNVNVIVCPKDKENKIHLEYLIKELGKMGIDSILLEGGGELNFSALEDKIVDKVVSFIAPKILGGREAKTPVEGEGIKQLQHCIHLKNMNVEKMDKDLMITGYIVK